MNVIEIDINKLNGATYNPRQLTKTQFEDLKNSLETFGFVDPIILNAKEGRENIIIGGHQRVAVAKKIGIKKVPAVYVDLDEKREKELNVRLNKNTGEWDWDKLANEFETDELLAWGFNLEEFGGIKLDLDSEDDDAELDKTLKDKVGRDIECPNCKYVFQD